MSSIIEELARKAPPGKILRLAIPRESRSIPCNRLREKEEPHYRRALNATHPINP